MKKILLTKGYDTFVDDINFQIINRYTWHAVERQHLIYAEGYVHGKVIFLHNFIMNPPRYYIVDHKDNNGLNNQEVNLRICRFTDNNRNRRKFGNSSQYKGVYFDRQYNKWKASIKLEGKVVCIGRFDSEIEAAKAYDMVAIRFFKEFTKINFPE